MLLSSIAIVIGPTPPGTGVRKPATSATDGSTSPTHSVLGAIDSDVDHGRARLDHVRGDHACAAHGGDEHVGLPAYPAEVGRAEWQIVTVAFRASSSIASGLADDLARPTTTARAPSSGISYSSRSSITPGRRRHECRPVEVELARVERMEAVDVLDRLDRGSTSSSSM